MSQTEETPKPTHELEAKDDIPAELADELEIVDAMKPAPAPASNNKPLKYGTRRKKAGEAGPNIQSLGSVSSLEEEEEIEMDDLPVKANAPEELIDTRKSPSEPRDEDGESRPRRQGRSRGERRERKPRSRSPETTEAPASQSETETESAADAPEEQDRPDRFGTVKRSPSEESVQEFRPSRDGRTAPKRERRPKTEATTTVAKPKKKGLLAKIVSFFTGGDETKETETQAKEDRAPSRNRRSRGKRGPQNRGERDENSEGGNNNRRRRRPRNRNRKPRQDGEGGGRPRGEGQGSGNGNNRRRRRKPRSQGNRERKETTAE